MRLDRGSQRNHIVQVQSTDEPEYAEWWLRWGEFEPDDDNDGHLGPFQRATATSTPITSSTGPTSSGRATSRWLARAPVHLRDTSSPLRSGEDRLRFPQFLRPIREPLRRAMAHSAATPYGRGGLRMLGFSRQASREGSRTLAIRSWRWLNRAGGAGSSVRSPAVRRQQYGVLATLDSHSHAPSKAYWLRSSLSRTDNKARDQNDYRSPAWSWMVRRDNQRRSPRRYRLGLNRARQGRDSAPSGPLGRPTRVSRPLRQSLARYWRAPGAASSLESQPIRSDPTRKRLIFVGQHWGNTRSVAGRC